MVSRNILIESTCTEVTASNYNLLTSYGVPCLLDKPVAYPLEIIFRYKISIYNRKHSCSWN